MKILSLNVRGLNSPKLKLLSMKLAKYDIINFQEVHNPEKKLIQHYFPNHTLLIESHLSNSAGVASLIRSDLCPSLIHAERNRILSFSVNGITITNIYAPNYYNDKSRFFDDLSSLIDNSSSIIIGDTNCVSSVEDISSGAFHAGRADTRSYQFLMNSCHLRDAAEVTKIRKHTCRTSQGITTRIDKALITQDLTSNIKFSVKIISSKFDHSAIILEINPRIHSPSNRFFFTEEEFTPTLITRIEHLFSLSSEWSQIKENCINSIQIEITRNRYEKQQMKLDLQKKLNSPSLDAVDLKRISEQLDKYEQDEQDKLRTKFIRSFDTQTTFPSKFMSNMLKKRSLDNEMTLLDKQGNLTNDPEIVASILCDYQNNIHQRVQIDTEIANSFLNNITSQGQLLSKVENPISLEEVMLAINKLKNSSPGPDSLPSFFYKKFAKQIAPHLLKEFNRILWNKNLPTTMSTAAIRYIKKNGADHSTPKGWRPISLINLDSKILSIIFAFRLQSVIQSLVPTQKAYIKGRNILENVFTLDYILENEEAAYVFLSDFSSAFDVIDHGWILMVLQKFGFGPYFRNGIQTLLSNLYAHPIVGSTIYSNQKINIKRGVRQGDPISGLLFILAIQPLLTTIEKLYPDVTILAYADDLAAYTSNNSRLGGVVQVYSNFEFACGLKLNATKSFITYNTILPPLPVSNINIQFNYWNYLGYTFHFHGVDPNLNHYIEKLENTFASYKKFKFSWIQKAVLVNTFIYPRIFYSFYASSPSNDFFEKVEKLTRWFFHSDEKKFDKSKPYNNKMSLERMYRPIKSGGFGLVSLRTKYLAIKLQMLMKHLSDKLPLSPKIMENLNYLQTIKRDTRSPIFWMKSKLKEANKLLNSLVPIIKKVNFSIKPNAIVHTSSNSLINNKLFNGTNEIDCSLKNCYKAILPSLIKWDQASLTNTQKLWITRYNINFNSIFSVIRKLKIRPGLKSFLIKLWNNAIFIPEKCHCGKTLDHTNATEHTLMECPFIDNLFSQLSFPNKSSRKNFFVLPSKQSIITNGISFYAFYKLLMKSYFDNVEINTSTLSNYYKNELSRYLNAFN